MAHAHHFSDASMVPPPHPTPSAPWRHPPASAPSSIRASHALRPSRPPTRVTAGLGGSGDESCDWTWMDGKVYRGIRITWRGWLDGNGNQKGMGRQWQQAGEW